ncbi:MAG: 3,4-dihydroxy-2-butanone-4-phosphate synthase, partial [Clostridia bacterium]|nr:3,4-dihydroxy-2-butanone-4-phosphate synthase [Clostridia bacterium]
MSDYKFNTIKELLEDIRNGKNVVLLDSEDRENEGDVICAAEHAT